MRCGYGLYMLKHFFDSINQNIYNVKWLQGVVRQGGNGHMTISEQIKILCVRCGISEAELARRLGKSPQSLNAKMKRESFTISDLEEIADAAGVSFSRDFILENGEKI